MANLKKCVALLLTALLLGGVFTAAAGAAERPYYLVLGDSIGVGAGISNSNEACYGRIVANTNGYDYQNDAVNGNRTEDLIARLKNPEVASHVAKADIISLSIGGNNFLRGNMTALIAEAQNGNYSRIDETVAAYAVDLDSILSTIRGLNARVVVLLQTLYNPAPGGGLNSVYQTAVDRLNAAMRKAAAEHDGVVIVEVEAAFGADNSLISWDNVHPNAAGNVVIAREVLKTLKELGLGQETEPKIVTPGRDWAPTGFAALLRRIADFFRRLFASLTSLFR